jgi:hypothetical protein
MCPARGGVIDLRDIAIVLAHLAPLSIRRKTGPTKTGMEGEKQTNQAEAKLYPSSRKSGPPSGAACGSSGTCAPRCRTDQRYRPPVRSGRIRPPPRDRSNDAVHLRA